MPLDHTIGSSICYSPILSRNRFCETHWCLSQHYNDDYVHRDGKRGKQRKERRERRGEKGTTRRGIFDLFRVSVPIFFETCDTNVQSPSGLGKRVRISAISIFNVNVSAANLESFVGSVLSWRQQLDLDRKALKLNAAYGQAE
ncbi:hypothetical protein E2542_SST13076 [Spatholobus suberectus]|nr:hypothetical protein E2542_SST13076 [Spatholobus suberectus]